ncbi:hypothetical protein D9M71_397070 [compost metagenome]
MLAAQTDFIAVTGFRLQVGVADLPITQSRIVELGEHVDGARCAETGRILAVDAFRVGKLVGSAELGRQLIVTDIGWIDIRGIATQILISDVRFQLVVVVAQAWQ